MFANDPRDIVWMSRRRRAGTGTMSARRSSVKYMVLTKRSPGFDPEVLPAHYSFLSELKSGGLLEQAGGFTDKSGGAYVLLAGNLAEAREIAERAPLHLRGCSSLSVHEWNAQ